MDREQTAIKTFTQYAPPTKRYNKKSEQEKEKKMLNDTEFEKRHRAYMEKHPNAKWAPVYIYFGKSEIIALIRNAIIAIVATLITQYIVATW